MALFILLLILLNGLLAMAEMAVVSARGARLEQMAAQGDKGAAAALALSQSPSRFLSTVQIGITLVGVLAGALGEEALAEPLAGWLARIPALAEHAESVAIVLVVVAITYLSLVVGELVPKRLALHWPERAAALMARPMNLLTALCAPLVALLSLSTDTLLRLLGVRPGQEEPVSEEEIGVMVEQGVRAGVVKAVERDLVRQVFRLDDRTVGAVMTPRHEVVWLDVNDEPDHLRELIVGNSFSSFPVADGSLDQIVGIVKARHVLAAPADTTAETLRAMMRPPLFVPESRTALEVLELFRRAQVHVAVVFDEYGGTEGIVTLHDVVEALAGDLPDQDDEDEPAIVARDADSWLVDGLLPAEELKALLGHAALPDERRYTTLGGFVMNAVGTVPSPGHTFEWGGFSFEVVDLDGKRIDKVLVSRLAGSD